jgi:hypothetical protein
MIVIIIIIIIIIIIMMNCTQIPTFPCLLLQVHVHSLSLLLISEVVCKRTKLI